MRTRSSKAMRKPSAGTVLGTVALAVAVSGVAWGAIPSANGAITGCYNMRSGFLRVIDEEAGQECGAGERIIRFAAVDGAGRVADADRLDGLDSSAYLLSCPAGTTLYLNLCFELETRAVDHQVNATNDCADEGRRLPSEGEMRSFRELDGTGGVSIERFEWTDELGDTDAESVFLYAIVGTGGSGVDQAFDDHPYRCVAGPTG